MYPKWLSDLDKAVERECGRPFWAKAAMAWPLAAVILLVAWACGIIP